MKKLLVLIMTSLAFLASAQDGIKPIIDMHLHDYTEESYYVAPISGMMAPPSYEEYKKQVKEMVKKYNIVKAVVSGTGVELDQDSWVIPGYLAGKPPSDTLAFKELIESGKLKVFGEIAAQYDGLTLSDPAFDPYLSICERYDIPVAIHSGGGPPGVAYRGAPKFRLALGDPFLIEDALIKHPKLRVYVMHAGGNHYDNMLMLMYSYRQVYVDLGVLLWIDGLPMMYGEEFLKKAKKIGFLDRVMFGSDQMVWPKAIEKSIKTLDGYDFLTEEDKRKIFYENAVQFLKLDQ